MSGMIRWSLSESLNETAGVHQETIILKQLLPAEETLDRHG